MTITECKSVAAVLRLTRPDPTDASYMGWRNTVILLAEVCAAMPEDEFYERAGRKDT